LHFIRIYEIITIVKLLLIEDEDFIRDLYKRQLELAGIPTDAYGMGNDGLNAAHQNPTAYDLVLLDIMLPDTNGLQILKDLKQNNATKAIPVILLTNLSQDMLIKEGFELGAEGYLVKAAYTPAQIVQEVKNILAKKPSSSTTLVPNIVPQTPDPSNPISPQAAPSVPAPIAAAPPPTIAIPETLVTTPPQPPEPPTNMPAGTPPPMSNPLENTTTIPSPIPPTLPATPEPATPTTTTPLVDPALPTT